MKSRSITSNVLSLHTIVPATSFGVKVYQVICKRLSYKKQIAMAFQRTAIIQHTKCLE